MIYKVSDEIIRILLNHGFIDLTEKKYPDHFARMQQERYIPSKVKRVFAINPKSEYSLKLDYTNIIASPATGINIKRELSIEELKS